MARGGKYWVIVSGGTPTSFRARDRETLLPTVVQLQRTQPDAVIKWFDGTRFFDTLEEATARNSARDGFRRERKPDWRPGGNHRDPRAKYDIPRDVRRARFKARQAYQQSQDTPVPEGEGASATPRKPWTDRSRREGGFGGERKPWSGKPRGEGGSGDKPFRKKPFGDKPFGERKPWSDKPRGEGGFGGERKPWGGKPRGEGGFGGERKVGGGAKFGDKPFRKKSFGDKPFGERKPWGGKPRGEGGFSGERKPWGAKPRGEGGFGGERKFGGPKKFGGGFGGGRKFGGPKKFGSKGPKGPRGPKQ